MAQTGFTPVQLYRSTTAAAVPLAADLAAGELAVNIADMKLYAKNSSGVVTLLASSSGAAGDVVGPSTTANNLVARYNGSTGKILKSSTVTIADTTGDMAGVGILTATTVNAAHNGTVGATTPAAGTFTAVTASSDSTFSSTGAITVSKGTTAQQPASPVSGMFRFNTTTVAFEGYNGTAFASIGGGASGGGTDAALYENDLLATANYTIGQGALVSGATITIASPAVVTLANTFTAGQPVRFTTTGALPTGLSTTAAYYVISAGLTTSAFQVSLTSGGSAVNTSGSQSGVHSAGKIKNASTVGPFIVASGVVYTVPSGSRWVVQ